MKHLFEPRSIAVIGASSDKSKIGYKVLDNILSAGFTGKVYPVNPRGGKIYDLPAYKKISRIKDEIDVAVLVIPAKFVYQAVEDCAKKKVKFLTIISSGFSEIGALEEERKIAKLAKKSGMRILGPNIFGHYSARVSLNATFGPREIQKGSVAIITQSGALGVAMIGKTAVMNIGLSAIISVGNKSDIDEADLMEYLIEQEETKIILMYIEGIQKGERLVQVLKKATKVKPVIVIKSGRSKKGAVAAASHTGSLAGSDDIFDAIMKQCGVLRAESLREALEWSKFLAESPKPAGENVLIVTNGGGIGVMATDACEKNNVKLYDNADHLHNLLSNVVPAFGSTKNPVDLTGQGSKKDYIDSLEIALNDSNIHFVMSLYTETAMIDSEELNEMIQGIYKKYKAAGKPILFSLFGGKATESCVVNLALENIPVFPGIYDAVSCAGALFTTYRYQIEKTTKPARLDFKKADIEKVIAHALSEDRHFLLANEAQEIMNSIKLPLPKGGIARSIGDAVAIAHIIGFPVVMKVVSSDIIHKSDVGGVILNLENSDEVMDAYQTIIHTCKASVPNARIHGVEIVEQLSHGTEVIIGGRRDKTFGPVIMFGLGGIYVEVMKDVTFRALPVSREQVRGMIKGIKSYPILLGVRGEPKKDIEGILDTILIVSQILQSSPQISDIEINPLMVYRSGEGVKAVDVRILLEEKKV